MLEKDRNVTPTDGVLDWLDVPHTVLVALDARDNTLAVHFVNGDDPDGPSPVRALHCADSRHGRGYLNVISTTATPCAVTLAKFCNDGGPPPELLDLTNTAVELHSRKSHTCGGGALDPVEHDDTASVLGCSATRGGGDRHFDGDGCTPPASSTPIFVAKTSGGDYPPARLPDGSGGETTAEFVTNGGKHVGFRPNGTCIAYCSGNTDGSGDGKPGAGLDVDCCGGKPILAAVNQGKALATA